MQNTMVRGGKGKLGEKNQELRKKMKRRKKKGGKGIKNASF